MNRRSFFSRLAAVAALPFVPFRRPTKSVNVVFKETSGWKIVFKQSEGFWVSGSLFPDGNARFVTHGEPLPFSPFVELRPKETNLA